MRVKNTIISLMLLLTATAVQAQITVSGNVYGGGNAGKTEGSTSVTVYAGDLHAVFGGARMANVEGNAFVHIDGEHASDSIIINKVYGGNDIAGTIGTSTTIPTELEDTVENHIHDTWNAFIRVSTKKTTAGEEADDAKGIFIGQLYGGGNGDYDYTSAAYAGLSTPVLGKTYLEIKGGTIAHVYGGGNAATVTDNTTIYVNNPSKVVTSIKDANGTNILADPNGTRLKEMGLNTSQTHASSASFQFARVFGGNNKAVMAIRPTWNLKRGKIRDLYSGGNQGAMIHPNGILLVLNSADLTVDNVYGGSRMADVNPDNRSITAETIDGTEFPAGYSARVLITAGDINNVYGGNDITGNVRGGNAVGIHSSIKGNVYGGGNGSYPYTDQESQKNSLDYGDYYYNPGTNSVAALNRFRPNAESVSIRVVGTDADHPTIIGGAIYCGGNSATLHNDDPTKDAAAELKIGSHVIADKVFLGNNGANMVTSSLLTTMKTVNSIDLTQKSNFDVYMDGVSMDVRPRVTFDPGYLPYSTKFGSFFCGGNVGSMKLNGAITVDFNDKVIIYEKLVGGSNDANVYAQNGLNAEYLGGLLGDADVHGNKLILNLGGLKVQPLRWKDENDKSQGMEWNTWIGDEKDNIDLTTASTGETSDPKDLNRRFRGGNIYGGCYNTGHVNGNVVINLNASIVDRKGENAIFDQVEQNEGEAILYGNDRYNITQRRSGVILDEQGMDVLGHALNVFGGGYGKDSEIWGSTTINLNAGYTFQIFGGGEKGVVGMPVADGNYDFNGKKFKYDEKYSCYVNIKGEYNGVYRGHADDNANMAEAEFVYGGSFEAPIAGNTVINIGKGRLFNTFAGSCNADILGHTETYVGRQKVVNANGTFTYVDGGGFPWIRDHIYGGNDLGGRILGDSNFINRVSADIRSKVYNPKNKEALDVTRASAYIEYQQGRLDYIFGGCYGVYDYKNRHFKDYTDANGNAINGFTKPRMENAFVNFRSNATGANKVAKIYGAGQGYSGDSDRDMMQNRSYILIDIPDNVANFQDMEVFGAGEFGGVGMGVAPNTAKTNENGVTATAVIDLIRGQVKDVFGASYKEGVTRRTIVNVPAASTIRAKRIFGGAYGITNEKPCDVFESHINYDSEDALVGGYRTGIFGGNNSYRRTLYSFVNINSPVFYDKDNDYVATVFGGGYGANTWSQYTEVNLNDGARVYETYGGGYGGMVLNKESVEAFNSYKDENNEDKPIDKYLGTGYTEDYLDNDIVKPNKLGIKCNTNVNINQGANVSGYLYNGSISGGYCYAGGYGATATVSGSTYIGLHGGSVYKDLYAGGTSGAVMDLFRLGTFTATTNAYIEGGTVRNVYGGGWEGDVGYTKMENGVVTEDIPGQTNVVIGIRTDQVNAPAVNYFKGVPAILRNAYGGGEGGAVFGQTNLTMNNGYIGYTYDTSTNKYEEKVHDETWSDHVGLDRLSDCGNLFGGGYDDNSSVDGTHITVWGGLIRNSIFGGGEIATIGRGKTKESGEDNKIRELEAIYKAGKTNIEMFNGHVKRNVFGGGKGYNILGYGGVHGFYTDGYVFGQTEVHIHGGEIGTPEGVAQGYGNVFGGGDVGYVYSKGYFNETSGKTSTGSPNHYYYYDENGKLTEDCKVVVAPMLQVKPGKSVTFKGTTYGPYDYVPTEYLNTLPDKTSTAWADLFTGDKLANGEINPDDPEERGVQIRNAVFAGGNVSSNSESYSNATTVFGNTTATLYDVFHRDFITVGTEHTGGLYGGGNLSLVGGYRELNITNYGTDYYGMDEQISLEKYQTLTNRERAYFKLEYQFQQEGPVTINGKEYKRNDRISEEEYDRMPDGYKNETYWKQYGFCSIYAGRLLNTIQRADFCGVFGSRLVLQGAKDRVADVADATEYTINRIGELSLNQQRFIPNNDSEIHGNYFGIYSVVNYLGNLTSDVHFSDPRRYVDKGQTYEGTDAYEKWKVDHLSKRDRNNGTSYNQVALASGVFLEITSENSTPSNKIYGDITGIVELDLINVKKDIEGGGYVYARNEHGKRTTLTSYDNIILSEYNKKDGNEARTKKMYTYSSTELYSYQTSGNFIHKSKRIVDDCYPNNDIYNDGYKKSPAHYWYIKGEVYIYDQMVSAYAGSATAYRKEVKIPLTITAGSNGRLQLLNVQPSLYAYYANEERSAKITSDGVKVDNESMTYYLNDVITWWDWNQLSSNEQKFFVKETYINVDSCTVDGTPYSAGTYVLENDASIHTNTAWERFKTAGHTVRDSRGELVTDLTNLFRSSNNISHDTGYVLTFDMNSPGDWNDWYTPIDNNSGLPKLRKNQYEALSNADKEKYREGPTYTLKAGESSGLYGQRGYAVGEVISQEVYDDYENTVSMMQPRPTEGQAKVESAYVALNDFGNTQAGNAISKTAYNALSTSEKANFAPAMVCVNTIQLSDEEFVLLGELVSGTDANLDALADKYMAYNNGKINADPIDKPGALKYIKDNLSNAWYITEAGLYGGQYFVSGTNYSALKSWCSLSESRNKFDYNYDAFDVLIDPAYHGEGYTNTYYHSPYSDVKSIEYEAAYTGGINGTSTLTYQDGNNVSHTLTKGDIISGTDFENYIKNEQLHYTRIQVDKGADLQTVYVVVENIIDNGTPYAKGQDISEKDYMTLSSENKEKVEKVTFQKGNATAIKYYCYEDYTPSTSFTTERGSAGVMGSVISADVFNTDIPNNQKYFTIQGAEPTETTTLYVSRESNAKDVTSEKVISVVYQYTYYEADDEGDGVSLVNELHVVNIHLKLESGAPEIGPLNALPAVLPGNTIGLKAPSVNPGLYEVLTNGWELFANEEDAMLHRNGVPFVNNGTPLYWYQNQKVFLAFYSKTYLGKTYSNYVPLTVANYHDLDAVMKDKEHHLYVDHPNVERKSKIYIDNRTCESDATKSELDLLKDFFDLSVNSGSAAVAGHEPLNEHVKGGADLEFILNSNVSPKAYAGNWTPIGNGSQCFEGRLHGDGYTISGLNNSLFGNLCGSVYNLGVTGSFTSAGIVDTGDGYVENCWISTTGTPAAGTKAVFGNPTAGSGVKQVVNCYYPTTNTYAAGPAIHKDTIEFYNGTVAYNLNGFYLNKRYYDKKQTSGTEYQYLKDENGTLSENFLTGYYPTKPDASYGDIGYVEERYADGDFIYGGGTIPESYDDRRRVVIEGTASVVKYAPIWPDDYIFFGQTLNFGYNSSRAHEEQPSHIVKSGGRLTVNDQSNRVYRAPAYYQSKEMDVAHYNLWAVLAANSAPKTITDTNLRPAYPNMTAIDFAGHNDNTWSLGAASGSKLFYPPLLDNEDGLLNIINEGETPNLLVYAPSEEANAKTYNVLSGYFVDPDYSNYDVGDAYRLVNVAPIASVHGHLVQGDLTATNDHLLVDKRDFNCPISYSFDNESRMWYQRIPDRYVDLTKGWETVSLPFTAELVTTQQKGEITHFYSGSRSVDENGTKTGHEYWLREYKGKKEETSNTFTAAFNYPTADGGYKAVGNTFLWDYYYSANGQKDANQDTYQTYYKNSRSFAAYPLLAAGNPYIVGFPGKTYYEFDLSGEWIPKNTAIPAPAKLEKQTITFASLPEITIGVSDDEQEGTAVDNYIFRPNYSSKKVEGYLLNSDGNSFEKTAIATPVAAVPFRPYFVAATSSAPSRKAVEHIIFDSDGSSFAIGDKDPSEEEIGDESLLITVRKHDIIVKSSLRNATEVRIFNVSGVAVASFTIQPGETVTTFVPAGGVYIVRAAGGRYQKKLAVN